MAKRRTGAERARQELPRLLDAAERGQVTIISRHGRDVAALVPIEKYLRPEAKRQLSILDLRGTGKGLWGPDSTAFLREMRDEWDR